MDADIAISTLNDFIFCPYSIYLHNVYSDTDDSLFQATPQTRGRIAHETVDKKTASTQKNVLQSLPVYSEKYGLVGKIDIFHTDTGKLIERKYQLKNIFRGQIYQLWAQMFCLTEMGYNVRELAFYEMSTNKMTPVAMPTPDEQREFEMFLDRFRHYNPSEAIRTNPNKCSHCIYCNLCDKTDTANVY